MAESLRYSVVYTYVPVSQTVNPLLEYQKSLFFKGCAIETIQLVRLDIASDSIGSMYLKKTDSACI